MWIKYYKIPFWYISYWWQSVFSANCKWWYNWEWYSVSINKKCLSLLKNNKHTLIELILKYNIEKQWQI